MTMIDTTDPGTRTGPPTHLAPVEDERAILGACLVAPRVLDAVIPRIPTGAAFYEPRHGYVWDAIRATWERGRVADALNVSAELATAGLMPLQVDPVYFASLTGDVPRGALADPAPYLERILAGWELRGGDTALARGRQAIAAPDGGDPAVILDTVVAEIDHARSLRLRDQNVQRVGDLVDSVLDGLLAYEFEEDGAAVPWPYRDLGGEGAPMNPMTPGQVIAIAGRPAMGKSTMLKDCVEYPAFGLGLPTLLVTYEMKAAEIAARVMSTQARVLLSHLTRPGLLTAEDRARIEDYRQALAAAPLLIVDSDDTSIAELDRLIRYHSPRLVAVDYLQIAVGDAGRPEHRRTDVERYTRAIKKLAGRREVPLLVGSQLNRANEQRRDKIPHLADLRESGSIEQDCDGVILIHREDYYEPTGPRIGEVDLIIGKQRNGPTGTVTLANRMHYASFHDMAT